MGFELRQVDLNELIVLRTLVGLELLGVRAGKVTNILTLGGPEVVVHTVVESEERSGSTDFGSHAVRLLVSEKGGHQNGWILHPPKQSEALLADLETC